MTLQQDLLKVEKWEKTREMHVNPSKCQLLHITWARNPIQNQYNLHRQILEAVDLAKHLGLEITHNLNWSHQYTKCGNESKLDPGLHTKKILNQTQRLTSNSLQHNSKAPDRLSLPCMEPLDQHTAKKKYMCVSGQL